MKALTRYICATSLALAVAACGGGGGGGGGIVAGGTGGTGIASGIVTGISSVIVNGVTFSCTGATVANDDGTIDQGSGDRCVDANNQGLLQPGMVVTVQGSINANGTTGSATRVTVRDDLKGPVSNKSSANNSFTVLNQTVLVDNDTRFEINSVHSTGLTGFANLADGMIVEVNGLPDGQGRILATFVETKPGLTAGSEFEIKGIVSVSGGTITIGGLTINNSGFATPALSNGQCVELHGSFSGNTLSLTRAPNIDDDCDGLQNSTGTSKAEVEGIINGFTALSGGAGQFKVGLQNVAVSSVTVYRNGVADDLANGVKVEAEGPISNGVLNAVKISLKPGVRIQGTVDSVSGNSANVLGVTVNWNANTDLEDTPVVGDEFEIRGFKSGPTSIIALRIRQKNDNDSEVRGPVDAGSIVSPSSFKILGVQVNTTSSTQFDGSSGVSAQTNFYSSLQANQIIEAKGSETSDVITAREVEHED